MRTGGHAAAVRARTQACGAARAGLPAAPPRRPARAGFRRMTLPPAFATLSLQACRLTPHPTSKEGPA
ncbi:hypothetical protein BURPS668_0419 [Burkholderia pseudomallei 668]|nr:hypothetical protein BURPS668_0419 [Burkholderia pseudomallei 668]